MIDGTTLDLLYAERRKTCGCGMVTNTPDAHEESCPFKPIGLRILSEAERAVPDEDGR